MDFCLSLTIEHGVQNLQSVQNFVLKQNEPKKPPLLKEIS